MMKKIRTLISLLIKFVYIEGISISKDQMEQERLEKLMIDLNIFQKQKAFDQANSLLKFEVENYWKRATYFWAFQIASFAGYFSVLNSATYLKNKENLFYTICIGLVTAIAWNLINIGSRNWQRHWQVHVEKLEDSISGPLLKSGAPKRYSVTKINEIVSRFIATMWVILALQYFYENLSLEYNADTKFDWKIFFASVTTIYFIGSMLFGYGRVDTKSKTKQFAHSSQSSQNSLS